MQAPPAEESELSLDSQQQQEPVTFELPGALDNLDTAAQEQLKQAVVAGLNVTVASVEVVLEGIDQETAEPKLELEPQLVLLVVKVAVATSLSARV